MKKRCPRLPQLVQVAGQVSLRLPCSFQLLIPRRGAAQRRGVGGARSRYLAPKGFKTVSKVNLTRTNVEHKASGPAGHVLDPAPGPVWFGTRKGRREFGASGDNKNKDVETPQPSCTRSDRSFKLPRAAVTNTAVASQRFGQFHPGNREEDRSMGQNSVPPDLTLQTGTKNPITSRVMQLTDLEHHQFQIVPA